MYPIGDLPRPVQIRQGSEDPHERAYAPPEDVDKRKVPTETQYSAYYHESSDDHGEKVRSNHSQACDRPVSRSKLVVAEYCPQEAFDGLTVGAESSLTQPPRSDRLEGPQTTIQHTENNPLILSLAPCNLLDPLPEYAGHVGHDRHGGHQQKRSLPRQIEQHPEKHDQHDHAVDHSPHQWHNRSHTLKSVTVDSTDEVPLTICQDGLVVLPIIGREQGHRHTLHNPVLERSFPQISAVAQDVDGHSSYQVQPSQEQEVADIPRADRFIEDRLYQVRVCKRFHPCDQCRCAEQTDPFNLVPL